MSWDEIATLMAEDQMSSDLSETVTLPGGVAATVIIDAMGQPDLRIGEYGGIESRLVQAPDPVMRIAYADGAALVEGDPVIWRETGYLVSRIDPDPEFSDWLRVELTGG
jgi:hypothetical protein